jgi:hypothetical protein
LYIACGSFPYRTPPKMIIFITFFVSTFTKQDHYLKEGKTLAHQGNLKIKEMDISGNLSMT